METALKKDGPSAGVSIAVAILSLINKKKIPSSIAFTGELSLKGDILPIGGLKEKITSAVEMGINKIYIPSANSGEVQNLMSEILDNIEIIMVNNFSQIYDGLFK